MISVLWGAIDNKKYNINFKILRTQEIHIKLLLFLVKHQYFYIVIIWYFLRIISLLVEIKISTRHTHTNTHTVCRLSVFLFNPCPSKVVLIPSFQDRLIISLPFFLRGRVRTVFCQSSRIKCPNHWRPCFRFCHILCVDHSFSPYIFFLNAFYFNNTHTFVK